MDFNISKQVYIKWFGIYLLFQPIIDILTALFIIQFNTSITPGFIVRNVALIMLIGYVLFSKG